jgi:phosphoribosylformylglycinamidine cyclo-ligase
MAHVTGGGLAANLERVMPAEVSARIDRSTWSPQPVFSVVGDVGGVPADELERTLNMGVGMVAVVDADDVDRVLSVLSRHEVSAWVCGEVAMRTGDAPGSVALEGVHPGW